MRIVRACRDAGLASVAVYAEPDLDALHVRMADEAYALGGRPPGRTTWTSTRSSRSRRSPARTLCIPGYGSWPRTPTSPRAVIAAGLTWIGPSPEAIERSATRCRPGTSPRGRRAAGAGHAGPGEDAERSSLRARIRATRRDQGRVRRRRARAQGGPARSRVPELFESATREAIAAFGRGECFVEQYLDRPRHVETQCLADTHGNVVMVSTRDCSLQRRHQKLVEEAPARS